MPIVQITPERKDEYNKIVSHPLQSYEWGEFREKTGVKVIRRGFESFDKAQDKKGPSASSGQAELIDGFQLTIHKIPHTPFTIGYLPKGNMPTEEVIEELQKIGKEENCIFIQLEPNVKKTSHFELLTSNFGLRPAAHPLFTKYTFILDLTKSEEELLKTMHPKTRYNIRLAQKKGVTVEIDDSEKAFKRYLELTKETTTRQKFYAHTEKYHHLMWSTLKRDYPTLNSLHSESMLLRSNRLSAHLLTAKYKGKILTTWILFVFHDTLYYPYGASSNEYREVMASNLIMWEAIKFGKKLGLKRFDMWGALGENPNPNDPWFGFHRFKAGYGPEHIEFVRSYDLVINPAFYQLYKVADKLRWLYLRLRK